MKKLIKSSKGFTLIELLIVIAVIGVLAAVVLVAINPAEQIARGQDASRLQAIAQVGHAAQAYATSQGATLASYSVYNTTLATQETFSTAAYGAGRGWQSLLVSSMDMQTTMNMGANGAAIGVAGCALGAAVAPATHQVFQGLCYWDNGTNFLVWTNAVSGMYRTRGACPLAAQIPVFIYDSSQGKAGVGCQGTTNAGVANAIPALGQTLK